VDIKDSRPNVSLEQGKGFRLNQNYRHPPLKFRQLSHRFYIYSHALDSGNLSPTSQSHCFVRVFERGVLSYPQSRKLPGFAVSV
jgi:hypothetical protein